MVRQTKIFLALCAATVLLLAAYLLQLRRATVVEIERPAPATDLPAPTNAPADTPLSQPPPLGPRASQRLFFRFTGVDSHYGKLAWIDTAAPQTPHIVESLRCEVVYAGGGQGICLSADRDVLTTYRASLFDARSFAVSRTSLLEGIPSRARVSIDGTRAAFTVFVSGHSYASLDFSTQSLIVDTKTGKPLADLESFEVRRDGVVIKGPDFNFWGVTFTPDARQFFATLSTAGLHYLVRGDIAARKMEVIHENVECPSLSPDAKHLAYKKRLVEGNRIVWQLQVLELASQRETALSERRSIDDQLEWLDDAHVLYSVPSAAHDRSPSTDVWVAPIDASDAPRLFLENAYSPSVERCAGQVACATSG